MDSSATPGRARLQIAAVVLLLLLLLALLGCLLGLLAPPLVLAPGAMTDVEGGGLTSTSSAMSSSDVVVTGRAGDGCSPGSLILGGYEAASMVSGRGLAAIGSPP